MALILPSKKEQILDKYLSFDQLCSIKMQGVPLLNSKKNDDETNTYRSALLNNYNNNNNGELIQNNDNIKTFNDIFEHGSQLDLKKNALGSRKVLGKDPKTGKVIWSDFIYEDWETVRRRRLNFGSGLQYIYHKILGKSSDDKWHLGIYSPNRTEWLISDWAASGFSIATVALYDTLGFETTEYILNHAEIPILVTTYDKVPKLLKISDKIPLLKAIIVIPPLIPNPDLAPSAFNILKEWCLDKNINLFEFAEVEQLGKLNPSPKRIPKPEDVWCICYTSGTTGMPKGVILTHGNIVACQMGNEFLIPVCLSDVHLSYMPLAHVYEKTVVAHNIVKGATIAVFRGDTSYIMEDVIAARPTSFPSVPRLLNRIYDKVTQSVAEGGPIKAGLFNMALQTKILNLQKYQIHHFIWDRLVFKNVSNALGGNVRIIISGSAPLSTEVIEFLRASTGAFVVNGYGSTETSGGGNLNFPGDPTLGHIGPPTPCCEEKLVSVPEMNYFAKENKGELWVRGYNVFKGYYKDVEKTKEALTDDGWYKTGDIASVDERGRFYIIDRKKNIFKLSQGEYVAPEKIENILIQSPFVAQVFVHGESLESVLVCVVVPDFDVCTRWGIDQGILPSTTPVGAANVAGVPAPAHMRTLIQDPRFKESVYKDLINYSEKSKLAKFEYVRAVHFDLDTWGVDNGLTPTFKLKRLDMRERFKNEISEMYEKLNSNK